MEAHRLDRDAISEMWFENLEEMDATCRDPRYLRDVRPDELRFAEFATASVFVCHEHQVQAQSISGEPKSWAYAPRHQLFAFRSPNPDMTPIDSQRQWLSAAATFQRIPPFEKYVRRYVQSHVVSAPAADLPRASDDRTAMIDQFTFDNDDDALAFWKAFKGHPETQSLTAQWTHSPALQLFFARSHSVFEDEAS
jgi:hypothetical protein